MSSLISKLSSFNKIAFFILLFVIVIFDTILFKNVYQYYNEKDIFVTIDGKNYWKSNRCYDSAFVNGWKKKGDDYYYFDEDTSEMVVDKTIVIDDVEYTFDDKGRWIENE